MEKLTPYTRQIMEERFGKDSIIALATTVDGVPHVRYVNGWYHDGAFYIISHRASGKMQQIARQPFVALAGEWFTGHGNAEDMGWFASEANAVLATKLREVFAGWIDNGHNDFADEGTRILRVRLTDGVLLVHGRAYVVDFT